MRWIAGLWLSFVCALAFAAPGPVVAIGGALQASTDEVWARVVQLAGGRGARFVVLGTASRDPERSARRIAAVLRRHGALPEVLPASARADDPTWVAKVDAARGVFFGGGEQARLVGFLRPQGEPSPLLNAIHALHRRGGVVAGTSAGAAVLSEVMLRDAPDLMAALRGTLRDGEEVARGFGFVAADIAIDQHFLARGRIGRLLPLMVSRSLPFGLGVEEDSAAVVTGRRVQALGRRGVVVVDLADAASDPALGAFNLRGARLHFLASGDSFDLAARRFEPAAGSNPAPAADGPAPRSLYPDMLGGGVLLLAMQQAAAHGESIGLAFDPRAPGPAFEWRLRSGAGTRAHASDARDDRGLEELALEVRPVKLAEPLYGPWSR